MNRRPTVTLLMPNRNNARVLDLVLERLVENTTYPSFELVVVDDGSTDESRQVLHRWRRGGRFREFVLLEREHGGVVEALNAGLAVGSGELVVQLDGDATVETSGWLERLVDFHQLDDRIGIVTPLVTFEDGNIHTAGINMVCAEGLHDRGTRPIEPTGRRTVHTRVKRTHLQAAAALVSQPAEVDAAIGVCMLYPRSLAEAVGGYDPGFSPVWFDDLDLSLSARRLGSKVFFVPGVEVLHRMSLRNDRGSRARQVGRRARDVASVVTPSRLREVIVRIERRNTAHLPHELRRLRRHYAYWRRKWGFDLLNPALGEILERYGDTEVCWAYEPSRREAGERIAAAWSGPPSRAKASDISSA